MAARDGGAVIGRDLRRIKFEICQQRNKPRAISIFIGQVDRMCKEDGNRVLSSRIGLLNL